MRIGITGSTGLIGSALCDRLQAKGHEVVRLVRGDGRGAASGPAWDPAAGWIERDALAGCEAVVHLAGASIGEGRWTAARKRELRSSRIDATHLLVEHLGRLARPPGVLVCASAVGVYGDRGEERLTEDAAPGEGFLADLVVDWEQAAQSASARGIRVVTPRFGVVLARHGGALPRMLLPVRLGVGGPLGGGRQWMPWITLADATRVIEFLATHEEVHDAINAVAPEAVTNAQFMKALGRVLHRPAFLPTPAFALRIALGEAADGLLLASARVEPAALRALGFTFEHPTLDVALPAVLRGERALAAVR